MLNYDFMQRALIAAVLIGLAGPSVGIFLVQRRLSLIGDGLGHVGLAGVALGVLTNTAPVGVALVTTIVGAAWVEWLRTRGRANGDVALAILFYGGIAGGVVLISQSDSANAATLTSYLFGSITTTTWSDVVMFGALACIVLVLTLTFRRLIFAVSNDEEYAIASGLPVMRVNMLVAILTAVTVVVSMRVVGLLLVSALMIVPVATAQVVGRSFRSTMALAMAIGVAAALSGVVISYHANTPSGGTIILVAIAMFVVAQSARQLRHRPSKSRR